MENVPVPVIDEVVVPETVAPPLSLRVTEFEVVERTSVEEYMLTVIVKGKFTVGEDVLEVTVIELTPTAIVNELLYDVV